MASTLAAFITVEPLEWQKGRQYVCRVTDGSGETYTGYLWVPEETWQEYAYYPEKSGYTWISIDEENHTLQGSMSFGMGISGAYMGDLNTELAYGPEKNTMIVRSGPIMVYMCPGEG